MPKMNRIDELSINTMRFLAADAVEQAGVGHAGTPLGFAPVAYILWDRFLKHNPANPEWADRDRFVLSCGHASLMLYALLHLTGYDLELDELKHFRELGSRTAGHPEFGLTPGVEITTGPLGQGFAHAVGMALAERSLAARYNDRDFQPVDHYTYVLASDGDMQEGVSGEAASLAGTLGLGKLICLYDDNDMQIEGSTEIAFREDVGKRFEAYGWQVLGPMQGTDPDAVQAAIETARGDSSRPSLIITRSKIGYGGPAEDTADAHHGPLGPEGLKEARKRLGWPYEQPFTVPPEVAAHMRTALVRGQKAEAEWTALMKRFRAARPEQARLLDMALAGELPAAWEDELNGFFDAQTEPIPPRSASGKVINILADLVPQLIGGAGDLGPSTKTIMAGKGDFSAAIPQGRNLHFGVREHAMAAMANGIALHGGLIPYAATYLVFSDYMRPAVRLAAMMGLRVVFIFTHDSIAVGKDGPTHQAIEQIMALRNIPNLDVVRPADPHEVVEAWKAALLRAEGPTALILARQNVPVFAPPQSAQTAGLARGGYVLWKSTQQQPDLILIGTGAETHLALAAGKQLGEGGARVWVVSMPSFLRFQAQDAAYRESVLPAAVTARISIEAGSTLGWERYVGLKGIAMGVDAFGASAPADALYKRFHLTVEDILSNASQLCAD